MRYEPSLATGLWPNEARGPENDTAPTDPSKSAPVELRLKASSSSLTMIPHCAPWSPITWSIKCQGQHGF